MSLPRSLVIGFSYRFSLFLFWLSLPSGILLLSLSLCFLDREPSLHRFDTIRVPKQEGHQLAAVMHSSLLAFCTDCYYTLPALEQLVGYDPEHLWYTFLRETPF